MNIILTSFSSPFSSAITHQCITAYTRHVPQLCRNAMSAITPPTIQEIRTDIAALRADVTAFRAKMCRDVPDLKWV